MGRALSWVVWLLVLPACSEEVTPVAMGGAGGSAAGSGGASGAGGSSGVAGTGGAAEEDVCASYCREFPALCADAFAADYPGGNAECLSTCAGWMPGSLTEGDGPTAWCRLKHTRAGASLPDPTHCQHAKKSPTEFCL